MYAAYEWWLARRPPGWTDDMHHKEPWVNCTSDVDRSLAGAVARVVRHAPDRETTRPESPNQAVDRGGEHDDPRHRK